MSTVERYEEWKNWSPEAFGRFDDLQDASFTAEFRKAGLALTPPLAILELGFGNGALAGWATQRGFDYTGTETNDVLIERAKAAGFRAVASSVGLESLFAAESLDALVAFDVLEHLSIGEIEALLATSRSLLRPGGVVLARVPSGDSPFGRAILHGDLTHRTALGSQAVSQLASRTGFELVSVAPPELPVRGLGLKRGLRRFALRETQRWISRGINLVFHDGHPRVITGTMVFVLRKARN